MVIKNQATRVFKTGWFSKVAKKAKISDAVLCEAIAIVIRGQADDLGGGVFKKRLSNNNYRSIILAKGREYWVYQYLFAKKDRANIDDDELRAFKLLAKQYAAMTREQADAQVADGHWIEICVGELKNELETEA
jgi:hypothetical protein